MADRQLTFIIPEFCSKKEGFADCVVETRCRMLDENNRCKIFGVSDYGRGGQFLEDKPGVWVITPHQDCEKRGENIESPSIEDSETEK